MNEDQCKTKKRGTVLNPKIRFEHSSYESELSDFADIEDEIPGVDAKTKIIFDDAKTILSTNGSPDIPFIYSVNPYCGCEHGCVYCYARPTHEISCFTHTPEAKSLF